jgi:hypothetical protein
VPEPTAGPPHGSKSGDLAPAIHHGPILELTSATDAVALLMHRGPALDYKIKRAVSTNKFESSDEPAPIHHGPVRELDLEQAAKVPKGKEHPALGLVAGSAFAPLIADQLNQMRAQKGSLEQRALAVITSSGALVALLFAFTAVANSVKGLGAAGAAPLPPSARVLMVLSVALFVIAVLLALMVNLAFHYDEVDKQGFDYMTGPTWDSTDVVQAAVEVAVLQAELTMIGHHQNNMKAAALNFAYAAEGAAVLLLAAAVASLVLGG